MNPKVKPQVILKHIEGSITHLVKKWPDNTLSVEGHAPDKAANHNINVPLYFFPIEKEYCAELFIICGKQYID